MEYFDIDSCDQKGCQHWREGNKCAKDDSIIKVAIPYEFLYRDPKICQVSLQIKEYRLKDILEGNK